MLTTRRSTFRSTRLAAAALVASIAFLAACPDSTGPTESLEVDFAFGINRLQTEPAFVVNPGTGEITLRGYFEAPCTPYSATARAHVTDNHITLNVYGREPDACRHAIGAVGYQATLRAIPAGTYEVNVIHNYPISNATVLFLAGSQVVVR